MSASLTNLHTKRTSNGSEVILVGWFGKCQSIKKVGGTGLQIISRLAPVRLSGQTYFCLDISHFWLDKHRIRLIATKEPPPPFTWCLNMKQVNFQSIYCTWASISMQEKWNAWYSKISITFVRTSFSSTSYIRLVMKLMK